MYWNTPELGNDGAKLNRELMTDKQTEDVNSIEAMLNDIQHPMPIGSMIVRHGTYEVYNTAYGAEKPYIAVVALIVKLDANREKE